MTETTPPTPPRPRPTPGAPGCRRGLTRASGSFRVLGTLVALGIIWLYFGLKSQYFFTTANIWNILLQASNIGVIAAGLTVVMITAEIDLSIGSLEALSGSVAAVVIIEHGYSMWLGIAAALGATVLAGAISGLITWKLRVVSFISTLAMLGIAQGVAFLLTNAQAIAGFPADVRQDRHVQDRQLPGRGGHRGRRLPRPAPDADADEARAADLRRRRQRRGGRLRGHQPRPHQADRADDQRAHGGIGGLILSSRLDAGNGLFGASDLLEAVAAVVIGGTSLFGGVGSVIGTAVGVVIIASINNGLILMNVPDFWQQIVVGVIIIARDGRRPAREGGEACRRIR